VQQVGDRAEEQRAQEQLRIVNVPPTYRVLYAIDEQPA